MKSVGFFKKLILCAMALVMLVQQHQAYSQALPVAPVANYVVNRAIGGVITKVAISRGFAANDARIAATMAGVSTSMTLVNVASTVGGVALAVAGAPVWLTVLGGLGILAAGAAIIAGTTSLSVESGKVRVIGGAGGVPVYSPPTGSGQDSLGTPTSPTSNPIINSLLRDGTKIYRTSGCIVPQECMQFPLEHTVSSTWVARRSDLCGTGGNCTGGEMVALYFSEKEFIDHIFDGAYWSVPRDGGGKGITFLVKQVWEAGEPSNRTVNANGTVTLGGWFVYDKKCKIWDGKSGTACSPGNEQNYRNTYWTSNYTSSVTVRVPPAGSGTAQFLSLDEAARSMSEADKVKTLSPQTIAQAVNNAWAKAASQPGYEGLPYSATQPVTVAEVNAWQAENPSLQPTLGDLLVPAVSSGTNVIPISPTVTIFPAPTPSPGPEPTPTPVGTANVNVVNVPTVRVEWGTDPGVNAPSLEQTPTAGAILSPLLNLMPSLRSFVVPSHSSVCPKPSFSIFERQIVMSAHCAMLDDNRPTLYAVMAFVWLMLGTAIILKA